MALLKTIITHCLILIIRSYQLLLSGLFGPCGCRFHPTCSSYALDALKMHGFLKGFYLTIRRLLRCHPWHPGGIDPVP
jgi:hypothetical protein